MARDEPIDLGSLGAIRAAQHPVTLEATIEDIDAQVRAVRKDVRRPRRQGYRTGGAAGDNRGHNQHDGREPQRVVSAGSPHIGRQRRLPDVVERLAGMVDPFTTMLD